MIFTSEYIFLNPKLFEITDIINNTRLEHVRKKEMITVEKLRLDVTLTFLVK